MNTDTNDPVFRQFEERLTAYVQGKLDSDSMREIEQYAESSPEFREMLQFEKQIACSVRMQASVANEPSFSALQERLNSEQENALQRFLQPVIDGLRGYSSQALIAASVLAISVITFSLLQEPNNLAVPQFETLSDGQTINVQPDRMYFTVAFSTRPSQSTLDSIGEQLDFRVERVRGEGAFYDISVNRSMATISEELSRLRRDSRFMMVERYVGETTER